VLVHHLQQLHLQQPQDEIRASSSLPHSASHHCNRKLSHYNPKLPHRIQDFHTATYKHNIPKDTFLVLHLEQQGKFDEGHAARAEDLASKQLLQDAGLRARGTRVARYLSRPIR
jgi:hypothetical protein